MDDVAVVHSRRLTQERNHFIDAREAPLPFPYGMDSASFRYSLEARMSRVITFDRGSKRRMRQIRWTFGELLSAVFLSLIVLGLCVLIEVREFVHQPVEPRIPSLRAQH